MGTLERAYWKLQPFGTNFPIAVQFLNPSLSEQDETIDCDLARNPNRLLIFVISPPTLRFQILSYPIVMETTEELNKV